MFSCPKTIKNLTAAVFVIFVVLSGIFGLAENAKAESVLEKVSANNEKILTHFAKSGGIFYCFCSKAGVEYNDDGYRAACEKVKNVIEQNKTKTDPADQIALPVVDKPSCKSVTQADYVKAYGSYLGLIVQGTIPGYGNAANLSIHKCVGFAAETVDVANSEVLTKDCLCNALYGGHSCEYSATRSPSKDTCEKYADSYLKNFWATCVLGKESVTAEELNQIVGDVYNKTDTAPDQKEKKTIITSEAVKKYAEATYPEPEGYSGFLPACAFSGTCRSTNDLVNLLINAGMWVMGFTGSLALLMFVYGGFVWVTSRGNAEQVKKGMGILTAAVIGLVIVFGAYVLINFLLDALQVKETFQAV